MADVEVLSAEQHAERIVSLTVRFKHSEARPIDRATAIAWLREGHSLIPVHGHYPEVHRGPALVLVEVEGEPYVRGDTRAVAGDHLVMPH